MNNSSSLRTFVASQPSTHPYSSGLASSASSSTSSVFSLAPSVSSLSSSVSSLSSIGDSYQYAGNDDVRGKEGVRHAHPVQTLRVPALPVEQRQNHRRTNRLVESSRTSCPTGACPMPTVPSLVRQTDRKTNFVDNLVDSAAQIVETIWPTYMNGKCEVSGGKGVLPLKTFIQETLRRSRTSYSTLQVALYYLIVIRPHIPRGDFSDLPKEESQRKRALQCGRRMFLAALILASKYLQDRNYSARAWSKISGLQTAEININEMAFLAAVNWRLHISESNFQKWTDLVVKYTPGSGCSASDEERKREWCRLILKLTPDLTTEDPVENMEKQFNNMKGRLVEEPVYLPVSHSTSEVADAYSTIRDQDQTPTPSSIAPVPKVTVSSMLSSSPETTVRPTPISESSTFNSFFQSTPLSGLSQLKSSAARLGSGNAMATIAATAQRCQLQRCTTEDMSFFLHRGTSYNSSKESSQVLSNVRSSNLTRRSSLSCSMTSSPESLDDDSSRSSSPFSFSRSSSISSASSFESVAQVDLRKHTQRHLSAYAKTPAAVAASGLNTPTPSPPKMLALCPRSVSDYSQLSSSGCSAALGRKRRVCELATDRSSADMGISPNNSSGMTPQMKMQLQMRTPPCDGLGSKRLRCGRTESNMLGIPAHTGAEEVS